MHTVGSTVFCDAVPHIVDAHEPCHAAWTGWFPVPRTSTGADFVHGRLFGQELADGPFFRRTDAAHFAQHVAIDAFALAYLTWMLGNYGF